MPSESNKSIKTNLVNQISQGKFSKIYGCDIYIYIYMFSYIFLLPPLAAEWRLGRFHFSDACYLWTSSGDELFLEQNVSAALCSWTSCPVNALICVPLHIYIYIYIYICICIYIYVWPFPRWCSPNWDSKSDKIMI